MHSTTPLSEDELHRKCHVHLVYLGNYIFGELRRLPMSPFPTNDASRNIGLDSHSSVYADVSVPRPDALRSGNITPPKPTYNGNLDNSAPQVGLDSHSSSRADVPMPVPIDLRSGNVKPLQKLIREYFSKNAPIADCDVLLEKFREKQLEELKNQNNETVSCPADTGKTATSESAQKAPPKELKQVSYQASYLQVLCTNFLKDNFPKIDVDIKNIQSIITEHKKKKTQQFETYLRSLDLKMKPVVSLSKLKLDSLNMEKKTHWSQIDPYSDLEETRSNPQDDNPVVMSHSGMYHDVIGGHTLRKRKRSYQCSRLRRENSATKFYREMCPEKLTKKKKPTKKLSVKPSRSPSTIRKKAQEIINNNKENRLSGVEVNRRLTRSYSLFQPIKSPLSSDNENVLDTDTDETEIVDNTVIGKTDNNVITTTNPVNIELGEY